jgi:protein-tyrosine phosphatase
MPIFINNRGRHAQCSHFVLPKRRGVLGFMIDLHCHILPGIDDGAADLEVSLRMARAFAADGVTIVACTPHILPGLYHNTGPQIGAAVKDLQVELDMRGIPLKLVPGADNHIVPDFVGGLRGGRLLSLAGSRYVLVEPPHHTMPARLEDIFFDLLVAGYVPILTHPERLSWIDANYETVERLVQGGVWMQITAASLAGRFGRQALYWAERMLDEGRVHILATDSHDDVRRPPMLAQGRDLAARRVGSAEAEHLVVTRPQGILGDELPSNLPMPCRVASEGVSNVRSSVRNAGGTSELARRRSVGGDRGDDSFTQRLWRLFN